MEEFQHLMKHLAQSLDCVGGKDGVGTMVIEALRREAKAVKYKTYNRSEKGKFRHHAYDQTDRGVSRHKKHKTPSSSTSQPADPAQSSEEAADTEKSQVQFELDQEDVGDDNSDGKVERNDSVDIDDLLKDDDESDFEMDTKSNQEASEDLDSTNSPDVSIPIEEFPISESSEATKDAESISENPAFSPTPEKSLMLNPEYKSPESPTNVANVLPVSPGNVSIKSDVESEDDLTVEYENVTKVKYKPKRRSARQLAAAEKKTSGGEAPGQVVKYCQYPPETAGNVSVTNEDYNCLKAVRN